jgi:hypothetical protein
MLKWKTMTWCWLFRNQSVPDAGWSGCIHNVFGLIFARTGKVAQDALFSESDTTFTQVIRRQFDLHFVTR